MIIYSSIMFAAAVVLAVFAVCIAKGNANLINSYRPERVKDKTVYCRKMGRVLLVMASVMAISGLIGLLGEATSVALAAVGVLIVGQICAIAGLLYTQKKYGGGIF